ncbi:MAG: RNA polymerase subunit sigma-24 [Acidobacteria bacterium]|nr:RNA polymerase subunit sigma-24 [Acidobacteriota bacterium]MDP7340480.1 sigma-70 family RNA polymerase sigma factor [Vicinamibacterales bacterium]MDP7479434.1 sigma-70 family RNA polymerase sigma factor [Vicinamibacterales bacterium]MDP7691562.1 sigma-70 family RNA polymerase sigma factor [Vicinamibacterales bacterium]HJN44853.1 sigma-70 family RNA polymerase sigma factor [Vicinamibacterales bacterium]
MSTPDEAVGTVGEVSAATAPFDLEAVFRAHYGRITGVIARVVRDPARAEELAVEVFLRLWREPRAQGDKATGWLYRTAVRQGLDELRRETRRARYEPLLRLARGLPTPEEGALAGEERQRVRLILLVLRRDQAELLLLRSHDLSYDELAATLDLRPTSVGTLLRRARQAFRKEYVKRYGTT